MEKWETTDNRGQRWEKPPGRKKGKNKLGDGNILLTVTVIKMVSRRLKTDFY